MNEYSRYSISFVSFSAFSLLESSVLLLQSGQTALQVCRPSFPILGFGPPKFFFSLCLVPHFGGPQFINCKNFELHFQSLLLCYEPPQNLVTLCYHIRLLPLVFCKIGIQEKLSWALVAWGLSLRLHLDLSWNHSIYTVAGGWSGISLHVVSGPVWSLHVVKFDLLHNMAPSEQLNCLQRGFHSVSLFGPSTL